MAVIDLKNTTINIYDGKDLDSTGVTAIDMTNPNADVEFQPKIMASPAAPITITLVDPGTDGALSVAVSGRDITVTLAYATAAITTTAAQLKTAIEASSAANALISIAFTSPDDGTGIVNAVTQTTLSNPNSIEVKIGEGNLTYSEKRPVEFVLDRGVLDTVKEDDQVPMDVSFDFTWEYITAATGDSVPTVEDALKRLGLASAWLNATADACEPICVNISVDNAPTCSGIQKEVTEIYSFFQEELAHDISAGQISCSGRANVQYATSVRVTNA